MAPHDEVVAGGMVQSSLTGTPAQARVTARVLAEPGKAYAIYVLGGNKSELSVHLPPGRYLAEWVDTKTGSVAKSERFEHTGGPRPLVSPAYGEDVALRIRATNDPGR
jgi:hypothetical protein